MRRRAAVDDLIMNGCPPRCRGVDFGTAAPRCPYSCIPTCREDNQLDKRSPRLPAPGRKAAHSKTCRTLFVPRIETTSGIDPHYEPTAER